MKSKKIKRILSVMLAVLLMNSAMGHSIIAYAQVYSVGDLTEEIKANVEAEIKAFDGTLTYYDTLEEAIDAAQGMENCTVTLMKDVATEHLVTINTGTFTLNLNGKTWTYNRAINTYNMLKVCSSGTITLTNGSTGGGAIFQRDGTLIIENVEVANTNSEALNIGSGKLIFNSGTVRVTNAEFGLWATSCNVEVNGGTFEGARRAEIWSTLGASIEVNGGEIKGTFEVSPSGNATLKGGRFGTINHIRSNAGSLLGEGVAYRSISDGTPWVQNAAVKELTGVTVEQAPVLMTGQPQPLDAIYGYDTPQTLEVTAQKTQTASGEISYQWYRNDGSLISGETGASYNIPVGLDAGTYGYYCAVSCDGYSINTQNAVLTIAKAIPTVRFKVITREEAPFEYGEGIYFNAYVTGVKDEKPDGTVTFKDGEDIISTEDFDQNHLDYSSEAKILSAGDHSFTAVYTPSTTGTGKNYESAVSAPIHQTIAQAKQKALKFDPIPKKQFGDASFTLSTTGGSGTGQVTYSVVDNEDVLSISGDRATIVGAGTVTLTAVKEADVNFKSTSVTYEITVDKAPAPSITFPTAGGIVYGQKMSECPLIGGSTEYGTFAWEGDDLIPVVNGGTNYNTVRFTPSAQTLKNYETISNIYKRLTIGFSVSQATPTLSLEHGVYGKSGERNVNFIVKVNPVGHGNYPTGTLKFIDCTSGSAIDITGGGALKMVGSETWFEWTGLAEKLYKIQVIYSGDDQYTGATSEVYAFDTTKKNQGTLSFDLLGNKTYGDQPFILTTTGGSGSGGLIFKSSDPTIVSISDDRATIHKAGNVTLTAVKAADQTYNEASTSLSLEVGKKAISVKADDCLNLVRGSQVPKLTYSVTGLVGSDTFTNPTLSATAVDTNTLGEYDIIISGGSLTNADSYSLTYVKGKLKILNVTTPNGSGGSFSGGTSPSIIIATPENKPNETLISPATPVTPILENQEDSPASKFTDLSNHWAKEAVNNVILRGLLLGTSDTKFSPNAPMTRGMLVTALGRLAGVDTKVHTTSKFVDVNAGSAYGPYIEWAYSKKVVKGIGGSRFAPDRPITREEIALIFVNYAKATGIILAKTRETSTYSDALSIAPAYIEAVNALQGAGIMMGGTDNKFNPRRSATRAEVASMMDRFIKLQF